MPFCSYFQEGQPENQFVRRVYSFRVERRAVGGGNRRQKAKDALEGNIAELFIGLEISLIR